MQRLSERTANFIRRTLRRNLALPWCEKLLNRFELPPAVRTITPGTASGSAVGMI